MLTLPFDFFLTRLVRVGLLLWAGFMVALFILPLFPQLMDILTISPNRNRIGTDEWPYEKSREGFFTDLSPGRVKMVEAWDGTFLRALMDYDGRMFVGERNDNLLTTDQQEYWEVVETADGYRDSHPLPFPGPKMRWGFDWLLWLAYSPFSIVWWVWKRYTYRLRGAVFVGLPGFRTIRIRPLDRFVLELGENGTDLVLLRKRDYSDHTRVAQFEFPVFVATAETKNMIAVKSTLNGIFRTVNPYRLAYNVDDWPHRLMGVVTSALATYARSKVLPDINPADATVAVKGALVSLIQPMGLCIDDLNVIDITPASAEHAARLAEPELAEADKLAAEKRAVGNAANIRESGKALREYPEAAEIAMAEVEVRRATVVAKNPNAFVFLGNTGNMPVVDVVQERQRRRTLPQPTPQQNSSIEP
ncbi:hypothetical protein IT396_00280 [Candidatus Nomurabacteria bacterium]|nr:hypothetical protein [Candidatus Nomurabacteria bacterium]